MLKVDIRNRILKPKVGEIITVIGDIYTTVAETIPDENGRCESCAFNDETKVGGDCGDFVSCSKLNRKDNVMFKLIERKRTKEVKKMNRISLSDRERFIPKEGEVFFAEVPGKGIDRKVKAVLLKDNSGCKNCAFFKGELKDLCMQINCLNRGSQLTFRRVRNGEI